MKETTTESTQVRDVYAIVTNRIIKLLEQGMVPWKRTWSYRGQPQNFVSRNPYHGINVLLLNSLNYPTNFFLTFKQVNELGGRIGEEEKGYPVVFWKWLENEKEGNEEKRRKPLLRYYSVFNVDQCHGIPKETYPIITKPLDPIHECDVIIQNMPKRPNIQTTIDDPYYHPRLDYINMRDIDDFAASEDFYEVLFHEMIHSTGHQTRLNRKEIVNYSRFGSEDYSIEELTAEIGACYLMSHAGLPSANFENSASYIQGWLKKLKSDRKFIVYAAGQAQKAADFILNVMSKEND